MQVLLTGGTGFLGRAILTALDAAGHCVVLFGRSVSRLGLAARAIDGDVRDRDAMVAAAKGCDALVHAAALVSIWQPRPALFDEVNVGGLENALAAVRAHRLSRVVYTSSFLARPPEGRERPLRANDYQRTKAAALVHARRAGEAGDPVITLVPGVIFGPGPGREGNLVGRLVADHLAGRLPGIVGGGRLWSFAYVEDVARAHVAALERGQPGVEYALGGDNLPQRAIFGWLRKRVGRREPREIPASLAWAVGYAEECRARVFGSQPLLTRGAVEIFRHDWPMDSTAAATAFGYRSRPLDEGLEHSLADSSSRRGDKAP